MYLPRLVEYQIQFWKRNGFLPGHWLTNNRQLQKKALRKYLQKIYERWAKDDLAVGKLLSVKSDEYKEIGWKISSSSDECDQDNSSTESVAEILENTWLSVSPIIIEGEVINKWYVAICNGKKNPSFYIGNAIGRFFGGWKQSHSKPWDRLLKATLVKEAFWSPSLIISQKTLMSFWFTILLAVPW